MSETYKIENSNWSQRHIINLSIVLLIITLIGSAYFYKRYRDSQVPAPSCIDGVMNQDEKGIDCEGKCVLICKEHMQPLIVGGASIIKTDTDLYDMVAKIENANVGKSPGYIDYIFHVFDKDNKEIYTHKDKVYILDASIIPVMLLDQSIKGEATSVTFEIVNKPFKPGPAHDNKVMVESYKFNNDTHKLDIKIKNNSLYPSDKVKVSAIIMGESGVRAMGTTYDNGLDPDEDKTLTITWYKSLINLGHFRVELYIVPSK